MHYKKILAAACLVMLPLSSSYAFLGPDSYAVVWVKGSDRLNLRSSPSTQGRILAQIPFNEIDVRNLGSRNNGWCNVQYGTVKGWVACKYLAEPGNSRYYKGTGYDMPMAIQKEKKVNSSIVSRMPINATGITGYEACISSDWCRVSYKGYQGYVQKKYLMSAPPSAPAPTPAPRPPAVITPQPR